MDPTLTEQQEALRIAAREIAERELRPKAARWDENEEFPQENRALLGEHGLLGLTVAERYGGLGLWDLESAVVIEELARCCLSTAVVCQLFVNGPSRGLGVSGSEDLRERYLPGVASGACLIGIGMSEPDAGSDALAMRARLRRAEGGYVLDAYKNFVTAGHRAEAFMVVARFPVEGERPAIGAVVVPATAAGVSVTKVHAKMGLRGCAEAEVAFDGVLVPEADVLVEGTPDGRSFKHVIGEFNHERLGNASMCVGVAQGALDEATRYARERRVGGRRLIEVQGIGWKLAEMSTKVAAARLLQRRAAAAAQAARTTPPPLETAQAKWYANVVAQEVANEAIQILGGYGYTREFPVERMFRDVRGLAIGAGTVEIQKNLIARLLDRD